MLSDARYISIIPDLKPLAVSRHHIGDSAKSWFCRAKPDLPCDIYFTSFIIFSPFSGCRIAVCGNPAAVDEDGELLVGLDPLRAQQRARAGREGRERLDQREPLGVDDVMGLVAQRAAHGQHVRLAEQLLEAHEAHTELLRDLGIAEQAVDPADRTVEVTLGDVPPVVVDTKQVTMAVTEVLSNALQATNEKTGHVQVHAAFDPYSSRVYAKARENLAALRRDAPLVLDGPITGVAFRAYVEQFLAATLAPGDVVIVGTWTDGLFVIGQRPGRSIRMAKLLPVIDRKTAVVFCT